MLEGHRPSIDRAAEICDALDLEFHIGPSRALTDAFTAAAPAAPERRLEFMSYDPEAAASRSAPPSPVETVETVRDRRLAELLAAIVSHWEALSSRYARDTWVADVYRWCPALSAQRSALTETIAWLGWRLIAGRASARAPDARSAE